MPTRRKFLRNAAITGAGVSLGFPAYSNSILGANDRVNVAVFGTNSRGRSLTKTFANAKNCKVVGIGDVDKRAILKGQQAVTDAGGKKPKGDQDFRRFLDSRKVDAVVIATPDHWHAPMAIMALEAGKHVYLEKPCSHNPHEGDLLIAKQQKTGKLVQMGNQTRSSLSLNRIVKEIQDGLIGEAYAGKAWYVNRRKSIGNGKPIPVPEWLDWDLWQGPAPREAFTDNKVHYKWHWFFKWGTGELLNNGTHEIDMCRWALGVDHPARVSSIGGRHHFPGDDWEWYDTQLAGFEYAEGKTIHWDGKSCNGMKQFNRGRGAIVHGTKGSVLMDRDGYWVYDLGGQEIRKELEKGKSVSMDIAGGGSLDGRHIANFIAGINSGEALNAPIDDASISVTTCHLGNMAQRTGMALHIDTVTGKPAEAEAMKLWSRDYEPGWEPKV